MDLSLPHGDSRKKTFACTLGRVLSSGTELRLPSPQGFKGPWRICSRPLSAGASLHLVTSSSFCVHLPLGPNVGCLNLPAYGIFVTAAWANIPPQNLLHDSCPLHHGSMPEVTSASAPTNDGVFLAGQQVTQLQNSRKRDSPKSWRSCSQKKRIYHGNPVSPSGTRNE